MKTIVKSPEKIYLDIKETIEDKFGLHISNPISLNLGLLNLKWEVETEKGIYVIKQFSKERYMKHGLEKISFEQDVAIREQVRQYENGTPCPRVLTHNGNVIHHSHGDERFIIMEYMNGKNLQPGTLNENQMFSLGKLTGHMHNVFNDGTYSNNHIPKFLPPSREERLDYWKALYEREQGNSRISNLVDKQIKATENFNLEWLSSCDPGWAHRDLWVDNLLFNGDQLSAILDFDRFAFDYPELDIARAIMSGALKENEFHIKSATAFLEGYQTERKLKSGTLIRSLRLLWYLESVWWITPELNYERYQEIQFRTEMLWLAENLLDLNEMFGDL
ncbi:MAG: phosphotransferase [Heyndrickxia sp.]